MRAQLLTLMITLIFLGSVVTTLVLYTLDNNNVEPHLKKPEKKNSPQSPASCKDCREDIKKALQLYSQVWKKDDDNYQKFRSQLSHKCHGLEKAILTQTNTPLGSKLVYDGEKKRTLQEPLFSNKTWHTCAVVGNGGIVANSSCGKTIDSAQFVIRCNLPPLSNGYEKHVGVRTNLVTANPSILLEKYAALNERRRSFVENLRSYGDSMLLLPAFSYGRNTPVSLRALYTIEDFKSPIRPVFFNPAYLQSLAVFWRSQGLKAARLSTGIIMTSLALELCENLNLYGFWPFSIHPYSLQDLTNHYYDDRKTKVKVHAMPDEFNFLLRLHSQGVLRLHLGDCEPDEK
ncbi:alpha-2,8-sialyltransferase 8F isoform X2 [Kryptolebias marmoratus]|uniref:alpha-2,8-sialyltransferase 8F isoform X2 n=1 Tax=Kryptolebias marmoratus TaxID=37003 RepID=UPI000D52F433|nr:alpha-2,8-sialyltransferase 8F isoform X2 [Kryptolebias marmoratus]